jgi:hypothetical protein
MDEFGAAFEHVPGRDIADGAVQADLVIVGNVVGDDAAGLVKGERDGDADAVAFEGFVPAFDFAVRLNCRLHPI